MKKVKIVIVSANSSFYMNPTEVEGYDVDLVLIKNNKEALAVVYNRELSAEYDYTILMHADVSLDLKKFLDHLEELNGKYDVVGLAGTGVIAPNVERVSWFHCGLPYFSQTHKGFYGKIFHADSHIPTVYSFDPALTDHQAIAVDGLLLCLTKRAIEKGLDFDETIAKFDFYDMDLCFSAIFQRGLTVGVLIEPHVVHGSVGAGYLSNDYSIANQIFKKKWKQILEKGLMMKDL